MARIGRAWLSGLLAAGLGLTVAVALPTQVTAQENDYEQHQERIERWMEQRGIEVTEQDRQRMREGFQRFEQMRQEGQFDGMFGGGGGMGLMGMLRDLDLTERQQEQLRELMSEWGPEINEQLAVLRERQAELTSLAMEGVATDRVIRQAAEQVGEAATQVASVTGRARERMQRILTEEQLATLEENLGDRGGVMQQMFGRGGRGMMGGGGRGGRGGGGMGGGGAAGTSDGGERERPVRERRRERRNVNQ